MGERPSFGKFTLKYLGSKVSCFSDSNGAEDTPVVRKEEEGGTMESFGALGILFFFFFPCKLEIMSKRKVGRKTFSQTGRQPVPSSHPTSEPRGGQLAGGGRRSFCDFLPCLSSVPTTWPECQARRAHT